MAPKPKSPKTVSPEVSSSKASANGPLYLPGDTRPAEEVERMIRVDHAGEYGAVRIYAGQLAVLGNRPTGDAIRAMAAQEAKHLKRFNEILPARRVRPTALAPLWHVAGYALGFGTALLGERAAMACTVAVEDVIDARRASGVPGSGGSGPKSHNRGISRGRTRTPPNRPRPWCGKRPRVPDFNRRYQNSIADGNLALETTLI